MAKIKNANTLLMDKKFISVKKNGIEKFTSFKCKNKLKNK